MLKERAIPQVTLLLLLVLSCGCRDSELSSLTGTVTVDGQPAPAGINLGFVPILQGSPSYGTTDENGQFVANYTFKRTGIEPGEHRVKLMPAGGSEREKMPSLDDNTGAGERGMSVGPNFPQSYYAEITKITISPGRNSIDIPLETKNP